MRELTADLPRVAAILDVLLQAHSAMLLSLDRLQPHGDGDRPRARGLSPPDDGAGRRCGGGSDLHRGHRGPSRFVKSRSVGAILGMVPRKHQSGEVDRNGRITKAGDSEARAALFEAAHVMLHWVKKWSGLKAWATKVAQRQGNKRATVALARKMAVVMHRMWGDRTTFRFGAVEAPATTAA